MSGLENGEESDRLILPSCGTYTHWKGGRYHLLSFRHDSTNDHGDRSFAIYYSIEKQALRVRDLGEFLEPVKWPDGQVRPRFSRD